MKKIWNKKTAACIAIIVAVMLIFTFHLNNKSASISEDKLLKCLSKSSSQIDKNNFNVSNFKLINSDLNKNIVFLSGYEYGLTEDAQLDFELFKYFNEKAGVRFYLSDMQFSASEIINRYFDTGDELLIKELYSYGSNKGPYDLGPYDKWTRLYEYNKTLDKDKKIKVCGIGIEGYFEHTFMYLNMIIDEGEKPSKAIEETINDIKNCKDIVTDENSYREFIKRIDNNMQMNTEDYKKCLGKSYENFKYVIDEVVEIFKLPVEAFNDANCNELLQNTLYKNFKTVYARFNGKYYGSFEILQASQKHMISNSNDYKHFGEMLNSKDSPVNNKVLSIEVLYKNCEVLTGHDSNNMCNNFATVDSKADNLDLIDKASKSDTTLFKLNGFKSPFKKNTYFISYASGGTTVDYFQYAILIKNAKLTLPKKLTNLKDEEEKDVIKYLNNNKYSLDIGDNDDLSSFKVLDDDIKNYEMFFTGESHAVAANGDAMLKFLKYLNKSAGVNYYLLEGSYSSGVLINKYLKTGDEQLLKSVYAELLGTSAYDQNYFDNWVKLYNYNKKLSEDKKITVMGMDIEFQQNTTWNCLNYLIKDKKVPSEIINSINIIKNKKRSYDYIENSRLAKIIHEDIQKKEDIYINFLGEDYFDFEMTIRNLIDTRMNSNDGREDTIYKNFNLVYSHYPKGKYFGQFGLEHIYLKKRHSKFLSRDNFVARLNGEGSPFKGKILSIPYVYFNCKHRDAENGASNFVSESFNNTLTFYDPSDSKTILYKLNSKDSPFSKYPYLVEGAEDGVTADYFQYVLTIKNSPACKAYK